MNLGVISYSLAAAGYLVLLLLLLTSWKNSLQARLLTLVVLVSVTWAYSAIQVAIGGDGYSWLYVITESLRYALWYLFLLKLFDLDVEQRSYKQFARWAIPVSVGFSVVVILLEVSQVLRMHSLNYVGHVILSIIGLAIIEQVYRNTSQKHLWAIKYLIIGCGGVFAYDLFLYSHALLFRGIDLQLWESRGAVHLVIIPMLAIAAARNKSWSMNIFVSREIVLKTSAFFGGGMYLLVMALAGYYLREVGGEWGMLTQAVFFTLAVILLVSILLSEQFRVQSKVFLAKHFYKNKYDYREEWLNLTRDLSQQLSVSSRYTIVIQVLARMVDARAGMIWVRDEKGDYLNAGVWQTPRMDDTLSPNLPLINYLAEKRYIVNVKEFANQLPEYEDLKLPQNFNELSRLWLIIPLFDQRELMGFVLLMDPLVERNINWEDRDLLKTASKQVSSFLLMHKQSEELLEAKQFEVFNRLSAFMVHDLKNIAAELELVAKNAERFKDNPDFIEDAFSTVSNAAGDIKKLLDHFRKRQQSDERKSLVDLIDIVKDAVSLKSQKQPVPAVKAPGEPCYVSAEKNRLINVIAHIIDNAQEATADSGSIWVGFKTEDSRHYVSISDTGHGMDKDFINTRLFRPFDTTKGNAGMGIGMFESRDYIRSMGGDIQVESEPSVGTTMNIWLPVASPALLKQP